MTNHYTWTGSDEMPRDYITQPWELLPCAGTQSEYTGTDPYGMMPGMPEMAVMPMQTVHSEPETLSKTIYTPGYLRGHIGKRVRAEFLVGDTITEKTGRLIRVGASYIVLESETGGELVMGDIYSVKFVTVYDDIGAAAESDG